MKTECIFGLVWKLFLRLLLWLLCSLFSLYFTLVDCVLKSVSIRSRSEHFEEKKVEDFRYLFLESCVECLTVNIKTVGCILIVCNPGLGTKQLIK